MAGVSSEEAVVWVQKNRGMICKKIFAFFPHSLQQDLDEFVSDAYVIAIEAAFTAEKKGIPFEAVFWTEFVSLLKASSVFYYEPLDPFDADDSYHRHLLTAEDPYSDIRVRFDRENLFSKAVGCISHILSGAEERIFSLFMGETEHGSCSLGEAAKILGIDKASAKKLALRIEKKITNAMKYFDMNDGNFSLDWEKMSRSIPKGRGRISSVSKAVLKELQLQEDAARAGMNAEEEFLREAV